MKYIISIILLFISLQTFAYPEMIRHAYVNCTACHISPAGGGVLTPYGRSLSAEILSTFGTEKEAQLFHGALSTEKIDEWLSVGGEYRGLQYHYENDQRKDGQWVDMQALLEFAIKVKQWTFDLAFGSFEQNSKWKSDSSRFFVMYQPTDAWSFRAGQFKPQFGLNIPQHNSPTRGFLGLGTNQERNSFEAQYSDETWTQVSTYSETISKSSSRNIEKSMAFKLERVFSDTLKPGFSFWKGESDTVKRQMLSVHGLLGFTKSFFLLTELVWQEQESKPSKAITHTAATYNKLGYELHKGVVGFLLLDSQFNNLKETQDKTLHYGAGVQFFPRPHFALEGTWTREQTLANKEGDYAWLLLHYYL